MISLVTQNLQIKRSHPGIMHVDGEPVNTGTEINVETIHRGLKILAPDNELREKKRKESENIFNSLTRWFN